MKKILLISCSVILLCLYSCSDKGSELQVTDNTVCYISRFNLRGSDNNVLTSVTIGNGIDTVALTINATVIYGTDLTKLKPDCSLSTESILVPENGSPNMGTWVDFSKAPYKYTVISGNRKVKKTYTVNVTAQQ